MFVGCGIRVDQSLIALMRSTGLRVVCGGAFGVA